MPVKRGSFSRSRNLEQFNEKFSQNALQNIIKKALKQQKTVRVLEIGCGEGRVLMELKKLFPQVEFHGINKKPWPAMKGSHSLKRTGTYYKIFTQSELKNIHLPKIYFYNATQLKFPSNYFDCIYSQAAIQYIDRKDLFLEEVWRVLKKQGTALLNIDSSKKEHPDYMQYETPRWIIYKNNKVIPLKKFLRKFKCIQYKKNGHRINLIVKKNKPKLKLHLTYDKMSSFNLNNLNKEKNNWKIYWGYRSVFKTHP